MTVADEERDREGGSCMNSWSVNHLGLSALLSGLSYAWLLAAISMTPCASRTLADTSDAVPVASIITKRSALAGILPCVCVQRCACVCDATACHAQSEAIVRGHVCSK
jgi:hypothetical protein